MTRSLQWNRRQMLKMSGAACSGAIWPGIGFAANSTERIPCIQVASDYAAMQLENENTPTARFEAIRASAQNLIELHKNDSASKRHFDRSDYPTLSSPIFNSFGSSAVDRTQALDALKVASDGKELDDGQKGIMNFTKFWPRQSTVSYTFLQDDKKVGVGYLQKIVVEAFNEWKNYCCLDFQYARSENANIRISFVEKQGHFSLVGIDSRLQGSSPQAGGYLQSLNLDPSDAGFRDNIEWTRSRARHEIGHAIGFCHEQQNPNNPVQWNEDAVIRELKKTQGWTNDEIRKNVLTVLNDRNQYVNTPRDGKSIMFYSFSQACLLVSDPNVPTLEKPNTQISATDIAFCREQYGCASQGGGNPDQPNTNDPAAAERPKVQSDRQKLKSADATPLKADNKPLTGEFSVDSPMKLYKIEGLTKDGEYVIETLDGPREGKSLNSAIPVVVELFSGADFSEEKADQTSRFGAFDKKDDKLTSVGSQDAFLKCTLKQGITYYAVVRPQQSVKAGSKWTFTLLFRDAGVARDSVGAWSNLRTKILEKQNETRDLVKASNDLRAKMRK